MQVKSFMISSVEEEEQKQNLIKKKQSITDLSNIHFSFSILLIFRLSFMFSLDEEPVH